MRDEEHKLRSSLLCNLIHSSLRCC